VIRTLMERLFPSIGKKVAAAVVLVLFVAGGLFVYFAQQSGHNILDQEMRTKAQGIGNLMNGILDNVMQEGHHEHLQQALENAVTSRDILALEIIRNDGSVALHALSGGDNPSFPLERFGALNKITEERSLADDIHGTYLYHSLRPIVKKPACLSCHNTPEHFRGFLAMTISMNDVRSAAIGHRNLNIAMSVMTFGGLGISIFLALALLVIGPIKRLHTHIRNIQETIRKGEQGDNLTLPLLIEPKGNDEIAGLCRDFNNLVIRLNDANEKLLEVHRGELERADRLASSGNMAASMAHEIKNPIAGILGAVQVFESETAENDPRREIFAEMKVQLERVNHAVNDLLTYARPNPPVFEQVIVNELIQKTVTLLSQQTKGRNIRIATNLPANAVSITADRKQLQQVIWNVLLNGIQAIESSGDVTVNMVRDNTSVSIRISDTGKGIPKEELDKIFIPFFSTKHKGTGLGMTISKRITELHHGTLGVHSLPGEGTTVTITLPSDQQPAN
jgi:signal transduction histidine kinase